MAFKPTVEQSAAITAKGGVLVAAAAGSGKTAVLVERVIRMLTDPVRPIPANRLLIVTFTNAAAAEMRSRIEKRLNEECAAHPDDIGLLRQRHLIASAKICTIDSFCIDLVRENFDRIGVSPDFRIGEESLLYPLEEKVLNELFGEYLANGDKTFRDLLDLTGSEYDEENLQKAIRQLFRYSRQMPFPDLWLQGLADGYKVPFAPENPWYALPIGRAKQLAAEAQKALVDATDLAVVAEKGESYLDVLQNRMKAVVAIGEAARCSDWDGIVGTLNSFVSLPLPRLRNTGGIPDLKIIKQAVAFADDVFKKCAQLFFACAEEISAQNAVLYEPIALLIDLTKRFADRLFSEQLQENIFTFYNTEQMALSMLCEWKDGGAAVRADARRFFDCYDEILVDEYQDTNDLQDLLFGILSDHERRLFVVGDVKQSIYGFRGANPRHFAEKKESAVSGEAALPDRTKKVILSKNFRSRPEICEYINFFFENTMTAKTGRLIYDEEERLVPGADFPPTDAPCVEMLAIDRIKEGEDVDHQLVCEARVIASHIRKLMAGPPCIHESPTTLRTARYADFAILLRATSGKSAIITSELRRQGIPVTYSEETFLETREVATFLSLLRVLDNPKNDVALLSVMMSPIFGFSAEELALVRANCREGNLIGAVTAAAQNGNRQAADFLRELAEMRRDAVVTPLPRLLSELLDRTDYLNIAAAMPDGNRRKGNLLMLVGYAAKYCETGSGGLGGFLKMIDRSPAGTFSAAKTGAVEETVRVMSMHASKGLQFPICILADTAAQINRQDSTDSLLFSDDLGIGFRYYDEVTRQKRTSVAHEVIAAAAREKSLEEELRLLYVAMTRAEDRLVLLYGMSDLQKKVASAAASLAISDSKISRPVFASATSMGDWLILTALLHPQGEELRKSAGIPLIPADTDSRFQITVLDGGAVESQTANESVSVQQPPDPERVRRIRENINYRYPFEPLRAVEAKSSVSRLANRAESERFAFSARPDFMERGGLSAAGRGTATHKVMQFIAMDGMPDVAEELERLVEWQYITEQEAQEVDRSAIERFFECPLYRRVQNAAEFRREMRFLTEVPASRVEPSLPEEVAAEPIVVQGAVDLCFVEDGQIVVVDFKTDRADKEQPLIDAYAEQLGIYAQACEKIFEMPVKEKIIYSFALGRQIRL